MTFSPTFEKALCAIANMSASEPPFALGQPVFVRREVTVDPDPTTYIVIGDVKTFPQRYWMEVVPSHAPSGPACWFPASWLTDVAEGEHEAAVRRFQFRVVNGGGA